MDTIEDIVVGSQWAFRYSEGGLRVEITSLADNVIHVTMIGGTDDTTTIHEIGDTWTWKSSVPSFLHNWKQVERTSAAPSVWLNVIRWAEGNVSFDYNEPYTSREEAVEAFNAEPFDEETGERCELLDTVEVKWRG